MSPSDHRVHTSAVSYDHGREHEPRVTWDIWRWVIGMALAAATAYFTTTRAIEVQLATVKATQESNFNALLLRLDVMQGDIREIRSAAREREREPAPRPSPQIYVPPGRRFDN